jgi:glucose-6-phosphate 1-dehydrogenase
MNIAGSTDGTPPGQTIETCDIRSDDFTIDPFTLVIFGGAGDLSRRKLLPMLFHIFGEGNLPSDFSIVGFGLPEMNADGYRDLVREAVQTHGEEPFEEKRWESFSPHLHYLSGDFDTGANYEKLADELNLLCGNQSGEKRRVIYYMAVPPTFFPVIINQLSHHRLCKDRFDTRIIIEKPFGRDRESADHLNRAIHQAFDERQIYRIDHYLGKETVQNIIFFRFANSIFEPLWNRRYIDNVQITVAEDIGIEHRGNFYEQAGVVRDIIQNHMLQLVALVAMEPPVGFEADYIRDEKVKFFRSIRPMDREYIDTFSVRGQYGPGTAVGEPVPGYRAEANVARDSNTPTFIAAKLHIDNWRWAGVPFYIRAGKRLPRRITQICVQFKQPPLRLFSHTCDILNPNFLLLTVQPREEITLHFGVKYPLSRNAIYPVNMEFDYQKAFQTKRHSPYERLLIDCMRGDLTLFVRQDGVAAQWSVVDPLIARWEETPATDFPNYAAGTWGPEDSDRLLQRDGRNWLTA